MVTENRNRNRKDITDFLFKEDSLQSAQFIFIAGGTWPEPAERAAELWCAGLAPLILPSGRFSITQKSFPGVSAKQDRYNELYQTEWEFYSDVLRKNGVPESAIWREDQATFTKQNADFSRRVTDSMGITVQRAILCCKSFHARRAWMYYQHAYSETQILVAPAVSEGISKENWYQTEEGRTRVAGELIRIGEQFSDLLC